MQCSLREVEAHITKKVKSLWAEDVRLTVLSGSFVELDFFIMLCTMRKK